MSTDGDLITESKSYTEKRYINGAYTEAPCPEKFKNVPLGVEYNKPRFDPSKPYTVKPD